jgi:hypothetical protein
MGLERYVSDTFRQYVWQLETVQCSVHDTSKRLWISELLTELTGVSGISTKPKKTGGLEKRMCEGSLIEWTNQVGKEVLSVREK